MISSQILQGAIDELRAITRIDLGLYDTEGRVVATTFQNEDISSDIIQQFAESVADSQVMQGCHFFKIFNEQVIEYVLISKGSNEDAGMIGKVAVSEIENLTVAYRERYDKNNFIQNLLLDNLLLVDMYNRAKKLHIGSAPSGLYGRDQTGKRQQRQRAVKDTFCLQSKRFHYCGG